MDAVSVAAGILTAEVRFLTASAENGPWGPTKAPHSHILKLLLLRLFVAFLTLKLLTWHSRIWAQIIQGFRNLWKMKTWNNSESGKNLKPTVRPAAPLWLFILDEPWGRWDGWNIFMFVLLKVLQQLRVKDYKQVNKLTWLNIFISENSCRSEVSLNIARMKQTFIFSEVKRHMELLITFPYFFFLFLLLHVR